MSAILIVKIVGLIVGTVASLGGARKDSKAIGEKRLAMFLAVLGFGVAVVAELVDASAKQQAAIEATNRNSALLAEVQRTLHPLFPLIVDVRFRAPLSDSATRAFRTALEQEYQREHTKYPDVVWLHPGDPEFPTFKKDPVADLIVSAALGSMVRLYSRQRTKEARFEQADVDFCPCPALRDIPYGMGIIELGDQVIRRIHANRDYMFSRDQGLYMRDHPRKIDFVDSKNTTDMMSADDLLGATIEIATQPFEPSYNDDQRPDIQAQAEWVTFAGVAITLPGWRQLVIDHQMFTPIDPSKKSEDWIRYRFIIPEKKNEFEKLVRDERPWIAAGRP